ncbi:MAG: hypothetical protein GXP42_02565, partial [Chloroflexi bacterium]|nr:hypothetical protein [Chloroflexota bacterium]
MQNASYGIYVGPNRTADGAWVTIKDNTISENGAGVVVDDAWETQITRNRIRSNGTSALARSAAALPDATGVGIYLRN